MRIRHVSRWRNHTLYGTIQYCSIVPYCTDSMCDQDQESFRHSCCWCEREDTTASTRTLSPRPSKKQKAIIALLLHLTESRDNSFSLLLFVWFSQTEMRNYTDLLVLLTLFLSRSTAFVACPFEIHGKRQADGWFHRRQIPFSSRKPTTETSEARFSSPSTDNFIVMSPNFRDWSRRKPQDSSSRVCSTKPIEHGCAMLAPF